MEENNESSSGVSFSADSSVNEPVDAFPSTHNKKEEEDNESTNSDHKSVVPPLPSTHDFVAALESSASNQETGNKDSQLMTLSNQQDSENEDS